MLPKSEAQRVIAISLGKIANYRSQRGGTSLHKNLLVANVLQKVRTFVAEDEQSVQWERQFERCTLSEACEPMAVDDSKVSCDQISENLAAKPNEEFPSLLPKTLATSECSNLIGSRTSRDAVNGSTISDVSMADYYSGTGPISTSADKEHSTNNVRLPISTTHSSNGGKSSREMRLRARCLKRRQAIEDRDIVLVKRRRYDMETTDVNHTSPNLSSWRVSFVPSDCDSDVESDSLDADQESSALSQGENTMDVEQICNLVSVFKCSFQGLGLIENPTVNNSETAVSSPTDYAFSNSQNLVQELGNKNRENKPPLRRGLSLPDLCAKQADMCQKFQLTAPVLALTV